MTRNQSNSVSFTWEEISWITGLPILVLIELFSAGLKAKGVHASELPPALDCEALAAWLQSNPGLIREVA